MRNLLMLGILALAASGCTEDRPPNAESDPEPPTTFQFQECHFTRLSGGSTLYAIAGCPEPIGETTAQKEVETDLPRNVTGFSFEILADPLGVAGQLLVTVEIADGTRQEYRLNLTAGRPEHGEFDVGPMFSSGLFLEACEVARVIIRFEETSPADRTTIRSFVHVAQDYAFEVARGGARCGGYFGP